VPKYFSHFRDKTMRQLTNYKWEAREDALETVYQAMQPAVRFSREDCVDLPPVTFETREIDLTPDQKRAWKSMWDQLHAEYQGGAITAVNEAVKLSKLTQIVSGAAIGEDGNAVILNPSTRLAELDNLLDEAPAKIIVFCPFRAPLGVIQRHLAKRTSVEVIHGGVSKTQRDQIFGAFQSQANPRVLVAQPAAMSHGLTLTAASVIVWYAPITSAETYDQANARISRPGQTRNQLIVHIQSTPLEAKMYRKLQDKISLQGTLLEMFRSQTARSAA
jgi:SNF2 family DNA or RNA helicase